MDFSALEAYVMVCQEGKMSRAAEKLFISKQALSMAIKRVEGEMGTKLLARTGSGVVMTAEGERFFSYAQRILALWKDCGQELEAMKARQRARLRVGFGYMIWNFWSKDMEDAFSRSYPQIALSVQGERSSSLLRKMDEGQLDLVITCMQSQRYDQYNHKMLLPMDTLVMMAQDDALAGKTVLTPWDLAGRTLLYPDSGAGFLHQFCRFLDALGIEAQGELVPAGNFLHSLQLLREKRALKLTSRFYSSMIPPIQGYECKPLIYQGTLEMPRIAVYALSPHAAQPNPALTPFLDFLMQQFDRFSSQNR